MYIITCTGIRYSINERSYMHRCGEDGGGNMCKTSNVHGAEVKIQKIDKIREFICIFLKKSCNFAADYCK